MGKGAPEAGPSCTLEAACCEFSLSMSSDHVSDSFSLRLFHSSLFMFSTFAPLSLLERLLTASAPLVLWAADISRNLLLMASARLTSQLHKLQAHLIVSQGFGSRRQTPTRPPTLRRSCSSKSTLPSSFTSHAVQSQRPQAQRRRHQSPRKHRPAARLGMPSSVHGPRLSATPSFRSGYLLC